MGNLLLDGQTYNRRWINKVLRTKALSCIFGYYFSCRIHHPNHNREEFYENETTEKVQGLQLPKYQTLTPVSQRKTILWCLSPSGRFPNRKPFYGWWSWQQLPAPQTPRSLFPKAPGFCKSVTHARSCTCNTGNICRSFFLERWKMLFSWAVVYLGHYDFSGSEISEAILDWSPD